MQQGNPLISVVLCTYNRAGLLRSALESLLAQSLEKSLYEIVVVDNASTDRTPDVVKSFQSSQTLPQIVLIFEPLQGLAFARNTGCKRARGAYVAFLDDDCVAPRDWLKSLLVCFESVNPEPWSVGGPIFPIYDAPKPKWFKDDYERFTWGEQARFLRQGESFFGGNMAFKRSLVEKYGGFGLRVGMRVVCLSVGEETALYDRMWQAAGPSCLFYYCPQAIMYHRIPPRKTTISYQLKRAFNGGQARYYLHAPQALGERFNLLMRATAALIWHGSRAILRARPVPSWENWVVEAIGILAHHTSRAVGCLGLLIAVKERDGK